MIRSLLLAALLVCPGIAQSAVLYTFQQVNANVVATSSGSITVPNGVDYYWESVYGSAGSEESLYFLEGDLSYVMGSPIASGLLEAPLYAWGSSFGYYGSVLFLPLEVAPGTVITPVQSFVWENRTLSQIFDGDIPTTTRLVFSSGGQNINFVAAPEPTRALLLAFATLGLLMRRTRR